MRLITIRSGPSRCEKVHKSARRGRSTGRPCSRRRARQSTPRRARRSRRATSDRGLARSERGPRTARRCLRTERSRIGTCRGERLIASRGRCRSEPTFRSRAVRSRPAKRPAGGPGREAVHERRARARTGVCSLTSSDLHSRRRGGKGEVPIATAAPPARPHPTPAHASPEGSRRSTTPGRFRALRRTAAARSRRA